MQTNDRFSTSDRELGMGRPITRRDFLNGVAVGSSAALAHMLGPMDLYAAAQDNPGYYPPLLTGMRGSHDGSYEVAHAMRDGMFLKTAGQPVNTRETYDLVVVGGGISGLSAAYFYRKQHPRARILILDNHDDFGGHAKRNEFRPNGSLLITNGGTVGIDSPFDYRKEARGLLTELGIDPQKLAAESDQLADRTGWRGLQQATFFDKETFGDRLIGSPAGAARGARGRGGEASALSWQEWLAKTPFSKQAKRISGGFRKIRSTTYRG
jgi:spermidine dehydrogenase